MNQKMVMIVGAALMVATFLLGFFPRYLKSRDLESQLNSTRQELASQRASERAKLQGDELDLLIGYVYLQTNLKNYGLASEYSTRFFDRVRTMAAQTSDPNRLNSNAPDANAYSPRARHIALDDTAAPALSRSPHRQRLR